MTQNLFLPCVFLSLLIGCAPITDQPRAAEYAFERHQENAAVMQSYINYPGHTMIPEFKIMSREDFIRERDQSMAICVALADGIAREHPNANTRATRDRCFPAVTGRAHAGTANA